MSKWAIVLAAILESAMIALIIQLRAPAPGPILPTTLPSVTASPAAPTPGPSPSPSTPTPIPPTATVLATSTPPPSPTSPSTNTPAPTSTGVVPTATRPPAPTNAPPPRPTSGVVGNTDGHGVYLRHSPNPNDLWVAWPDNTPLALLGPQATVAGQVWLQVRDPAGDVGWVPARFVVVR